MIAAIWFTLALSTPGCSRGEVATTYSDVLLEDLPHVGQKPDFCGEACGEMALRWFGAAGDQDALFGLSGVDPALGRGAYAAELKRALEAVGFAVGDVWYRTSDRRLDQALEEQWGAIHADLQAGWPTIVCARVDDSPLALEHFRLVVGYDAGADQVLMHDPAVDEGAYLRWSRTELYRIWPLAHAEGRSTIIRLRLEPASLKAPAPEEGVPRADLVQHVMKQHAKLPHGNFSTVIERPFVVIGDGGEEAVRHRAEGTIRRYVRLLRQDYFESDPEPIHTLWLFRDGDSLDHNVPLIFGRQPSSYWGYYDEPNRAVVVSDRTGGGTLAHELVHAFMAANFPGCPPWFEEGLASLYEYPDERAGHIYGHTNWRLPELQAALRAGTVPSFSYLTSMDTDEFYGEEVGLNYAQARYLCHHLQERGLLRDFFRRFLRGRESDPTGYATLQQTLGIDDTDEFRRTWERYVLELTFPPDI